MLKAGLLAQSFSATFPFLHGEEQWSFSNEYADFTVAGTAPGSHGVPF